MVGAVALSSVVAVSRADRSFIVFGEGISQLASLAWRQITAANWWDRQGTNHRISIGDRLCRICGVCAVGYV